MQLQSGKKLYFASDNHLGAPDRKSSLPREKLFVQWLDAIKKDAQVIFLLGDLFDFWFEYKKVVPKGFVRVLGKLAELRDAGIEIHYFVGNHDLWMNGYFEEELQIPVYHQPRAFVFNNQKFWIGHGDGLGPGDKGFKRMKKVFTNPFSKWLFRWLHPDLGVRLAQHLSVKNKLISGQEDVHYLGKENEWLAQYALRKLEKEPFDYFIFGHRHLPIDMQLTPAARYINLGDWISQYTYAVFDGKDLQLNVYRNHKTEIYH
ncbi:MAG: UDP-2,3-diacylglucosamine diphosphatase [Bacteroidetes bacterium]|nr:UDP-2,3-diacylglucosamine diphosphatase [Bacteroidota bacterium]